MKIYAVFKGSYSDRDLVAVFSSLDAANDYQQYIDRDNEPEEFELDSINTPDWWDTQKTAFICSATINRSHVGFGFGPIECREYSPGYYGKTPKDFGNARFHSGNWRIVVKVFSSNTDEAIHKASEHFNRWIYNNQHIFQK